MSSSLSVDEINNVIRTVGDRSTGRRPVFLVGEPTDPVFRRYVATPERVHYKTEIFNEEVDQAFRREPRRTLSNATQSTQSTRQSSTFDDATSFNGSVDSSVTTAPSTRFGTAADPAAHMVATMPDRSAHRLCCEFAGFEGCNANFALEEVEAWIDHNMEHLGDQLPPICLCWFCDDIVFDTSINRLDLITNFRDRMEHICTHIRDDHYNVHQIRPDFYFFVPSIRSSLDIGSSL